ncbi:MAG: hypothetical protein KDD51_13300 [Bdellovibrionales bacterium]|nr:hypothetical protein [Bdellovibrionales bacterium]
MLQWLVVLLTVSLSGVAATRTSTCEKTSFDTHIYPHLLRSEPRLKEQIELIRNT